MTCYKEEIFGPVLVILDTDSLDDVSWFILESSVALNPTEAEISLWLIVLPEKQIYSLSSWLFGCFCPSGTSRSEKKILVDRLLI